VLDTLADEAGDLPGARAAADFIKAALSAEHAETHARAAVGRLALLAAAAALRARATPAVAEVFARTRLRDHHDAMLGTSEIAADETAILLERALPSK
jgi:putative acyl-CoA dehydrogenase